MKFNKTSNKTSTSVNLENGIAFSRNSVKRDLISIVLNSMLSSSYYETEKNRIENILNIASEVSPEFLAKLMIYVRNEGYLRSVSHLLAVKLSEEVKGSSYLRDALYRSFIRPDDLTEVLSLWNSRNSSNLPNSLRRAMKDTLEDKFTEYHISKYQSKHSSVKLKDVVKLCRPSTKNYKTNVFKDLIEENLKPAVTAQSVNASFTDSQRFNNYKVMLKENKLGYMALLKNIKNIIESGLTPEIKYSEFEEVINLLCDSIENETSVLNSKVLPFRFTQALNALSSLEIDSIIKKKIEFSLEIGFSYSSKNINLVNPNEKVALLLDESGSMMGRPFEIGKTMMASMLSGLDKNNTVGYLWADNCREVELTSPFSFIKNTHEQGGGTDVWAPLDNLIQTKTYVDLIVIFTDMQMYNANNFYGISKRKMNTKMKEYQEINPNVKLLFWNLEGYNTGTPIQLSNNILEIAGFSDNMLQVIPKLLKDKDALVNEIDMIKLKGEKG